MNFLLDREDAEKHPGLKSCFYCNKVFNNYRALGGHLRIHQEDKTLRTMNCPGRSSNPLDISRNPPASLPDSQQNSIAGGNKPISFTRTPPQFGFSRMFCSNETNHASRSKFSGSTPGVAQTLISMSPDFSRGCGIGATYYHNSLSSRTFASIGAYTAMPYAALATSDSIVANGFPKDTSLNLESNGVCEFNTDEFSVSQDGLPPSSGNALENIQGYNLGTPPRPGLDKVGQYDRRNLLTSKDSKRPYLADESGEADIMTASKKPKIAPNAHVEPQNLEIKELPLFTDDGPILALEPCFGAEEEGQADVDLSLHL